MKIKAAIVRLHNSMLLLRELAFVPVMAVIANPPAMRTPIMTSNFFSIVEHPNRHGIGL